MFGLRKKKEVAAEPIVATGGAYRIKIDLYETHLTGTSSHWWRWSVYTREGKCLNDQLVVGEINETNRDKALQQARQWIDKKVKRDRLFAEAQEFEEWYGETPEVMQKTITTQESYIQQLEAKLDEFRRPDGYLDADAMVEETADVA